MKLLKKYGILCLYVLITISFLPACANNSDDSKKDAASGAAGAAEATGNAPPDGSLPPEYPIILFEGTSILGISGNLSTLAAISCQNAGAVFTGRVIKPLISGLSGQEQDMKNLVPAELWSRSVQSPNGTVIKNSWEALWTEESIDESLAIAGVTTAEWWWTGTTDNGTGNGPYCDDGDGPWTSASSTSFVNIGKTDRLDASWVNALGSCNSSRALLCVVY